MERFLFCCLVLSASGCGARPATRSSPAPARQGPSSAVAHERRAAPPAAVDSAGKVPPAASVHVAPLAPPAERDAMPRVVIAKPAPAERVASRAVRDYAVGLHVEGLAEGDQVLLSLDGRRPRPFAPRRALRLGDLLPEDESIDPGSHALVAVAVDRDGVALRERAGSKRAFSLIDFEVGESARARVQAEAVRLFCLGPAGTFHGKDADRLLLSLLVVGSPASNLPLSITGSGLEFRASVDPALPYAITGLSPGDFLFRVMPPAGPPAECIATLNRDAGEPRTP